MMLPGLKLVLHIVALLLLAHMVYPRLGHVLIGISGIVMEFLYLALFLIS